jgi:hypothetical protein
MTNCSFVDNTGASYGAAGAAAGAGAVSVSSKASLLNCRFYNNMGNTSVGGGAVFGTSGSTIAIAGCLFVESAEVGRGHNDVTRCIKGRSSHGCDPSAPSAVVVFSCPAGTTGESMTMAAQDLLPTQLPPAKQLVHCTPKAGGHTSTAGGHTSKAGGHTSKAGGHTSKAGGHTSKAGGHTSNDALSGE